MYIKKKELKALLIKHDILKNLSDGPTSVVIDIKDKPVLLKIKRFGRCVSVSFGLWRHIYFKDN